MWCLKTPYKWYKSHGLTAEYNEPGDASSWSHYLILEEQCGLLAQVPTVFELPGLPTGASHVWLLDLRFSWDVAIWTILLIDLGVCLSLLSSALHSLLQKNLFYQPATMYLLLIYLVSSVQWTTDKPIQRIW